MAISANFIYDGNKDPIFLFYDKKIIYDQHENLQ